MKTSLFIISFLYCISLHSQWLKIEGLNENYKGKVHSVEMAMKKLDERFDKENLRDYGTNVIYFDKSGNKIKEEGMFGNYKFLKTYFYNDKNRLEKIISYTTSRGDTSDCDITFFSGKTPRKFKSENWKYKNGLKFKRSQRTWNSRGVMIEDIYFLEDGTVGYIEKYDVQKKGRIYVVILNDSEKKEIWFDRNGNIKKEVFFKDGKEVSRITRKFNRKGLKVREITENPKLREDGIMDYRKAIWDYRISYDKNSNIKEVNFFLTGDFEKIIKFEYEFDEAGNWVLQRMYENGKYNKAITRKIEYYK